LFFQSIYCHKVEERSISPHNKTMMQTIRMGLACLLVSGGLLGNAVAAESAAVVGTEFDWRAFLAPFHTVTLHLPIGFVMMAAILEVYYFLRPSAPLRSAIGLVLIFSAASAVVVVLLGIFRGAGGGYEPETLNEHRWFGIAVGVVTILAMAVHFFAFRGGKSGFLSKLIYRFYLVVDLGLLTIAGHSGGNLTHGSKYLTENAPEWVLKWMESSGEGKKAKVDGDGLTGEYARVIQPIFEARCYQCHGPEKHKGDYQMDTIEGLFASGESDLPPIVKGNPLESYLVETITVPEDNEIAMPPDGKKRLTPEETLAIIHWIWGGAKTE
jgi:mono/diheme cytochrome c family protein